MPAAERPWAFLYFKLHKNTQPPRKGGCVYVLKGNKSATAVVIATATTAAVVTSATDEEQNNDEYPSTVASTK